MPTFVVRGGLVFQAPIGDVFRGLHFDPSGWTKDIRRIHYFVMPLYEPTAGHVSFSFARVLGGSGGGRGDRWWSFPPDDRTAPFKEIRRLVARDAIPWLERFGSAKALARRMREITPTLDGPYVSQAVGLSLILTGDIRDGLKELRAFGDRVRKDPNPHPWLSDMAAKLEELRAVAEVDPADALRRLREWRLKALLELRLDPWSRSD
jgi:hypothetical protein